MKMCWRNKNLVSELFNKKTVGKQSENVKITSTQVDNAKDWLEMLNEKVMIETHHYTDFRIYILEGILGYDRKRIKEHNNHMEFQITDKNGKKELVIEAKGSDKDLYKNQHYDKESQRTPILQTWTYMGKDGGRKYGICTNYNKFILMVRETGYDKQHVFDFKSIEGKNGKLDEEKLKEFIHIFSMQTLLDGNSSETLTQDSLTEDRDFTKEFYKLFHETRLILIKSFQDKEDVPKEDAIHYAQIFLNRLIFIFFVTDKHIVADTKIFNRRILEILNSELTQHSKRTCNFIKELFTIFDEGDEPKIFGFNGGLFKEEIPDKIYFNDIKNKYEFKEIWQHSKLREETKLDKNTGEIIKKYPDLNPIISNLLILDSFDFNTEISVNILGHIFEQSISDLEELQGIKASMRKKDGVYYTSEYITDYICRNTIIPYLSKSGKIVEPHKLVNEYIDDIENLEKKFKEIKILDPACGSGAFLVKAVDVLLEIHKAIQDYKELVGKYKGLEKWNEESEARMIIENNIYGVDINEQSVGIAKLALFFRIASSTRKLPDISKNIKVGNSLISDKTVDQKAFDWEKEFPEIIDKSLEKRGFSIIITNPPWQILKPDVDEFFTPLYDQKGTDQKFSKLTKNKKNNFVKECLKDIETNNNWIQYNENYKKQMKYFNSIAYNFQTAIINNKKQSSDINLYKLFIERSYGILANDGYFGAVVPSGIYSDLGSKGLREMLFEKTRIKALYSFINRKGIFEDVDSRFKFCTLVFEKGKTTDKFPASFYLEDITKLQTLEKNAFQIDVGFIKSSSPDALSIIECSQKAEFDILQKLYKISLLSSDEWSFKAAREFDMSNDSNLFHTVNVGFPLYEGKMMNSFTHTFAKPRYWIDEKQGIEVLRKKELNRMKRKNKNNSIKPRIDSEEYRLVWRSITNSTNERTLIATIIHPNVFLGNSLNYLNPIIFDGNKYIKPISQNEMIFICGVFNSFVVDFILRHKVATNLNIFYLMELPIPRYDENNSFHKKIFENSAKLICTTKEYFDLRNSIGIQKSIIDPDRRLGLEAQINANAAKIYDLTREQLEFILEGFPIVDKKLKEETVNEFDML